MYKSDSQRTIRSELNIAFCTRQNPRCENSRRVPNRCFALRSESRKRQRTVVRGSDEFCYVKGTAALFLSSQRYRTSDVASFSYRSLWKHGYDSCLCSFFARHSLLRRQYFKILVFAHTVVTWAIEKRRTRDLVASTFQQHSPFSSLTYRKENRETGSMAERFVRTTARGTRRLKHVRRMWWNLREKWERELTAETLRRIELYHVDHLSSRIELWK